MRVFVTEKKIFLPKAVLDAIGRPDRIKMEWEENRLLIRAASLTAEDGGYAVPPDYYTSPSEYFACRLSCPSAGDKTYAVDSWLVRDKDGKELILCNMRTARVSDPAHLKEN